MKHGLIIRIVMWLTRKMDALIIVHVPNGGCFVRANYTGSEIEGALADELEKDDMFRETALSAIEQYLSRFPEQRGKFIKSLYNHE